MDNITLIKTTAYLAKFNFGKTIVLVDSFILGIKKTQTILST